MVCIPPNSPLIFRSSLFILSLSFIKNNEACLFFIGKPRCSIFIRSFTYLHVKLSLPGGFAMMMMQMNVDQVFHILFLICRDKSISFLRICQTFITKS